MTSPTEPLKKRLSRLWRLEVDTGTDTSPSWTMVRGMTKMELTIDPNEVDVSDFDSAGWTDSLTTFRSFALSLEGFDGYTGPDDSPITDPGQDALKARGLLTGPDAYIDIHLYRTDTNKGYQGRVSVNYKGAGGDVKGAEPFNCDLTGSGALTTYTVPSP